MTARAIFLDIETYPTRDSRLADKVRREAVAKAPSRGTRKELKSAWHGEDARERRAQAAWLETSVNVELAEVLVIGVALDDEAPIGFTAMWGGETERGMLEAFATFLREKTSPATVWVGHGIENFDLPIILNRHFKSGVQPAETFPRFHHGKWWGRVFDTMQHIPNRNGKGLISLSNACLDLGLPEPKTKLAMPNGEAMSGAHVREAMDLREFTLIENYCLEDVDDTRGLYKALTFDGQWGTWEIDAELEEAIETVWKVDGIGKDRKSAIVLEVLAAAGKIPRWFAGMEGRSR